jgi:peptide/nickel transport system substrate-binding protein
VADLFTHNIPIAVNQGGRGMGFELVQETDAFGQVDFEQLVVDSALGLDEEAQKQQVTQIAIAFNELLPMIPLYERYGNNPVLEGVRVQPWPADVTSAP